MSFKALAVAAVIALSSCAAVPAMATDFYVGGSLGTAFQADSAYDNQTDFGIQAGADFGTIRTELGYDHFRMSNDGSKLGQVNVDQFTVRGFVEHDLGKFTPYVGAGVGLASFNGSGVTDKDKTNYVLLGNVGVNYRFNTDWSAGLGYEYSYSPTDVAMPNGTDSWQAHAVKLTARYHF